MKIDSKMIVRLAAVATLAVTAAGVVGHMTSPPVDLRPQNVPPAGTPDSSGGFTVDSSLPRAEQVALLAQHYSIPVERAQQLLPGN